MTCSLHIRPFAAGDGPRVCELFIAVNRLLAPPQLQEAFEAYIARSLREEIGRIEAYYGEREGGFWVAAEARGITGMFGLEAAIDDAMELRRMYVDASARGRGIGRQMLAFAESVCRNRGKSRLVLSTSELQKEALALYRTAGYRLVREEIAESANNKTIGGGIRRYLFEKCL